MNNNKEFIQAFLTGEPQTMKVIYAKTYPYVERYILSRNGSKKDAEDVFHNSLLHLYVKLKENSLNIQHFESYLVTVCKNLWKRESGKTRVTNIDGLPLVSESIDMGSFFIEEEQWSLYKEMLKKISQQCQEILKLVFDKVGYDAIVKTYGYSSQTVARQRVFKCKTKLVQLIKKDERYKRLKN